MPDSTKDEGEISTFCNQTFVILDRWLNQIGREKGKDASRIVKETFQNNIKANLSYYESIAKNADENEQHEIAATNRLMAKLYKGFLA